MKKSDKRSPWEKEWASAFEGEAIKPSERVWESIDASLAKQEVSRYKKKALFYQYLAAACFLLACCSISYMLLRPAALQEQQLAEKAATEHSSARENMPNNNGQASARQSANAIGQDSTLPADEKYSRNSIAAEEEIAAAKEKSLEAEGLAGNTARSGKAPLRHKEQATGEGFAQQDGARGNKANATTRGGSGVADEDSDEPLVSSEAFGAEESLLAEEAGEHSADPARIRSLSYIEETTGPKEVQARINKVWMMAPEMFKKFKQEEAPRYLVGASIASNYFNPNFENTSGRSSMDAESLKPSKGSLVSNVNRDSWNQESVNQPSINAGIQAAGWLGKKLVLQGGVQYGNYKSTTVAGTYVDAGSAQAYPLHYANYSADKVQTSRPGSRMAAPVSALNTFEFISVPLRLGYVVFDKKVGLLLSPGISSEIFLKNQISDQDRQLSTYTVYGGEESPFNTVHFRGTFGAQLYYKLSEHYMISVEPNYQHSITDFNKEGSMFRSRPSNLGLSAGFRYIIR